VIYNLLPRALEYVLFFSCSARGLCRLAAEEMMPPPEACKEDEAGVEGTVAELGSRRCCLLVRDLDGRPARGDRQKEEK
jgi:hypothetical protein